MADVLPGSQAADLTVIWRTVAAIAATAGCVALMEQPWLDPATFRGSRNFGHVFIITLGAGLLLWSLGVVRRNRSQFRLKTVLIGTTLIAAFLAAMRAFPPHYPVLLLFSLFSLLMLRDALRTPAPPAAFRSGPSRIILGLAGALGSAHVIRIIAHGLLRWQG